jgi:hypothetical protein
MPGIDAGFDIGFGILRFRQWLRPKNNSHGKKSTENTEKSNDNSFYA